MLLFARPSRGSPSIYQRTRKALICLGILFGVTHLPTIVVGTVWVATLHARPSQLYPVIPGCSLETTITYGFWCIVTPSMVRC